MLWTALGEYGKKRHGSENTGSNIVLIKIRRDDDNRSLIQHFMRTSGDATCGPELILGDILLDHHVSTVGILSGTSMVLKLVKARTWHEHVKVFWKRSRTHTEYTGAQLLNSIGIAAPEVYEMGISFPIPRNALYIGYYLMEDLRETGFKSLSEIQEHLSVEQISVLTRNISDTLTTLDQNSVLYSDLHLDNIFCHPVNMALKFIDTGAKRYKRRKVFEKKHKKAIRNLRSSIELSCLKGTELDIYCQSLNK